MSTDRYWKFRALGCDGDSLILPEDEGFNGADGVWRPTSWLATATEKEWAKAGVTPVESFGEKADPTFFETVVELIDDHAVIKAVERPPEEATRLMRAKVEKDLPDRLLSDEGKLQKAEILAKLEEARAAIVNMTPATVEEAIDAAVTAKKPWWRFFWPW